MSKEIIVNKGKQTRIAITENGELAELFIENQEHERTIGNIFLGRIRRIMPSIQAAFVDIGQKQDAFLHFTDLIENVEDWLSYAQSDTPVIGKFKADYTTRPIRKKRRHPGGSVDHHANRSDDDSDNNDEGGEHHHLADAGSRDKRKSAQQRQHGSHDGRGHSRDDREEAPYVDPTTILKKDQLILVKISKEPIANKGSRITTDISLAGRFLVLVPMANYVAVSKKILSFKERRRLRALARSLLPEGFGVIVRTVADGRSAKALDTDLNLLIEKWKKLEENLLLGPKAPVVVHEDVNMVSSIMRDLFTEDYDHIVLDDQRLYRNIKGYVQAIAPDMVVDVKFHEGPESIFDKAGIAQAVEEAFESRVNLLSGGYLFIETTEAMHVIDVNSGRAGRGLSQEENSLRVNVEAAKILAKQVRLRDLGGIIVVDFIDMRNERNRRKVYETLKTEFRKDRAVTKVLTMSDFGLIQITRQRLRPSITKTFSLPEGTEATPKNWNERAPISSSSREFALTHTPEEFKNEIETWFEKFKASGQSGKVVLILHPFAAAYFQGGLFTQSMKWFFKYGVRVEITEQSVIDPMSFRFLEKKTNKDITSLPKEKFVPKPVQKPEVIKGPDKPISAGPPAAHNNQGRRDNRHSDSSNQQTDRKDSRSQEREKKDVRATDSRRRDAQKPESNEVDSRHRDDRNRNSSSRDDQRRDDQRRDDQRSDIGSRDSQGRDSRTHDERGRGSEGRSERGRPSVDREEREGDSRGRDTGNRGSGRRSQTDRNDDFVSPSRSNPVEKSQTTDSTEGPGQEKKGRDLSKRIVFNERAKQKKSESPETRPPVVEKDVEVGVTGPKAARLDEKTASPSKTAKPKARKATPKKPASAATSKSSPAKTAVVPETSQLSLLEVEETSSKPVAKPQKAEVATAKRSKASPAKKVVKAAAKPAKKETSDSAQPASAPSRHRLEKYDFSQAALAKSSSPKKDEETIPPVEPTPKTD